MRALWRLAAPVAFGAAGRALRHQRRRRQRRAAAGHPQRPRRPDPGRAAATPTTLTQRVERLRAEVDRRHRRAGAADRRIGARSAGLARPRAGRRHRGGHRAERDRHASPTRPRSADRVLPEGTSPDDVVVHQQDVQGVVNALWAGGAEAMQIMDQRVVATSAVRCVGNTLILQGRVYSPPYDDHRRRRPRAAGRRRSTTSPGVGLYRYYVDTFGLVYETARRHQDHAARRTTGRWTCMHARVGSVIRTARPRPRRAPHHGGPGACCCSSPTSWCGPTSRRTGAADQVADDIRDGWTRPPAAARTGTRPRRRSTTARASRSCTSRGSAGSWSVPVVQGVSLPDLSRGVGHYPETALPGQVGNFAVAGHRATNGEPFAYLDQVQQGRRGGGRDPRPAGSPTSSTAPGSCRRRPPGSSTRCRASRARRRPERLLTLTTCNPRWASYERLIVFGHLQESRSKADGPPAALVRDGGKA